MKSDFPDVLQGKQIPRHIAIIMDGSGRWAKQMKLSRIGGHRKGADTVRDVVTACRTLGVEVLTLYAFSEENWGRPRMEVSGLMKLLKTFLVSERDLMTENGIRLRTIGNTDRLPQDARDILDETLELTKTYTGMSLVLALSYGGRDEILRAIRKIAQKVSEKEISPEDINAELVSAHLDTAGLPDPELLIRTSGEHRVSNFLPWQSIYTEFFVTSTLWPNFSVDELYSAIVNFNERERRYGLTSEQLPASGGKEWHAAR